VSPVVGSSLDQRFAEFSRNFPRAGAAETEES
jgi:hypothetical protein